MRIKLFSILCLFFLTGIHLPAQVNGYRWNLSAGAAIPAGLFAETHFAGAGITADYSNKRFGQADSTIKKKLDYIISSGLSHYFGRTEKISGYPYTYRGYLIFHTYGGVIYNAGKKVNIHLTAGPALSHYNKTIRFNIGSDIGGSFYFSKKWGISPGLLMIAEPGAAMLIAGSVKVSRSF